MIIITFSSAGADCGNNIRSFLQNHTPKANQPIDVLILCRPIIIGMHFPKNDIPNKIATPPHPYFVDY